MIEMTRPKPADSEMVRSACSDVMKTADMLAAHAQVVAGVHPHERTALDRLLEDVKLADVDEMQDGERFDGLS